MNLHAFQLRRPAARWDGSRKFAACPMCSAEVTDTLGAPLVASCRLAGHWPLAVDGAVNVRGYRCEACQYVLAVDPADASVQVRNYGDDGTEAPWVPVGAVFADASKRPIIVPRREVAP